MLLIYIGPVIYCFGFYDQFSGDSYIIVTEKHQQRHEEKPPEAFLLVLRLLSFYILSIKNRMSTAL